MPSMFDQPAESELPHCILRQSNNGHETTITSGKPTIPHAKRREGVAFCTQHGSDLQILLRPGDQRALSLLRSCAAALVVRDVGETITKECGEFEARLDAVQKAAASALTSIKAPPRSSSVEPTHVRANSQD